VELSVGIGVGGAGTASVIVGTCELSVTVGKLKKFAISTITMTSENTIENFIAFILVSFV